MNDDELKFTPCGWILGHEILRAHSRGARIYELRACAEPSAEAAAWSVEQESIGRGERGTLVAFICKRKGIFGETEALLAWLGDGSPAPIRFGASASLQDSGGAWVPRVSHPIHDSVLDLGKIEELSDERLSELKIAIGALLDARAQALAGRAMIGRALMPDTGRGPKEI
jgi:hypothetical protein